MADGPAAASADLITLPHHVEFLSDRWLEEFSIPGAEGYEANQRAREELGSGELYPFVLVFRSDGGDELR